MPRVRVECDRVIAEDSKLVTVCSACKRACCWDGYFMCDDSRTASTIQLTVAELKKLGLEHSDFYLHNRDLK